MNLKLKSHKCEVLVFVHDWGQALTLQIYKIFINSKLFLKKNRNLLAIATQNFVLFIAFADCIQDLKIVGCSNKVVRIITFANE